MRDKAKYYAYKVNDLLYPLSKKIDSLREQMWKTKGLERAKIHQELLMANLLSTAASHVHDKYNEVMNEVVDDLHSSCADGVNCHMNRFLNSVAPQEVSNANISQEESNPDLSAYISSTDHFKPEMPIDSDEDW